MKPENLDVVWHPGKKRCLRVDVRRLLPKIDDPKTGDASAAAAAAAAAAAKRQAGVAQTDTPRFNPGLYQSLVHLNGKLLAQVMILVEETKS